MKDTCDVRYCDSKPTYQVEVAGFFKQYMCDKHAKLMSEAVKPTHFYGLETLS